MRPDFHILLVEDSRADVKIIERALTEGNIPHRLTVLHDGTLALDYLNKLENPDVGDDYQPDLVLLDLNLPGLDGCQVLTQLKNHPILKTIPVVVLTSSRRDEDVLQTYQAGANSYIQKPAEYPRYCDMVKTLQSYWHETAVRPPLIPNRPRP
jgi:two-component system, chemotaxis family, response regulator Rcp1